MLGRRKALEAPPSALPSLPSPSPSPPPSFPSPQQQLGAQSVSGCPARVVGGEDSGSVLTRPWPEAQGPQPLPPSPPASPPSPELDRTPWDTVFNFLRTSPRLEERSEEVSECAARSSLPGPRPGTLLWGVGWREVDTAPAPHPAPLDSVGAGGREEGKVREKVGNSRSQD